MASQPQPATQAVPPRRAPARTPSKVLDKMRANPKNDWEMADVVAACRQLELTCNSPTRGSHHKVSSPYLEGVLTVPYNRPIKPIYIKQFVALAEAHLAACQGVEKTNG